MLRINNLLSREEGKTKLPGLNSEQINFRELPGCLPSMVDPLI